MTGDPALTGTCGHCGRVGAAPGTALEVTMGDDVREIAALLNGYAVTRSCPNCGHDYVAYSDVCFTDTFGGVVISTTGFATSEMIERTRARGLRLFLAPDDSGLASLVNLHIGTLATTMLNAYERAEQTGRAEDWLDASVMIPLEAVTAVALAGDRALLARILERRLVPAALEAIDARTPVPERLDRVAHPQIIREDLLKPLREQLVDSWRDDPVRGVAIGAVLAWHARHLLQMLANPVAEAWALSVLTWQLRDVPLELESFMECLRDDARVLGGAAFVEASTNGYLNVHGADALLRMLAPVQVFDVLRRSGVFTDRAVWVFRDRLSPEALDELRRELWMRPVEDAVLSLCSLGLVGDAVAVVDARADALRDDRGGAVLEYVADQLRRDGRPEAAKDRVRTYLAPDPERTPPWLSPGTHADLVNLLGNVERELGDPEAARRLYERALVDASDDRAAAIIRRNLAGALRDIGRVLDARDILYALRGEAAAPDDCGAVLLSLAICLDVVGAFEEEDDILVEATELALQRGVPHSVFCGILEQRVHALIGLGRHQEARAIAEQLFVTASEWELPMSSLAAAGLASDLARTLGHPDANAAAARAQAAVERAEMSLRLAPQQRQRLDSVKATLAADRGDTAAIEAAIASSERANRWRYRELLAQAHARQGAEEPAALAFRLACDDLFWTLATGQFEPGDVGLLRRGEQLVSALVRAVLADELRPGISGADNRHVITFAAELSSGLSGGLMTWVSTRRTQALEALAEPARLLEGTEPAAFLVAVPADGRVVLALARAGGEDVLLEVASEELERARHEVAAVTRRGSPDGDPLRASAAWLRLAERLGSALESQLEDDDHFTIVTGGALGGLPLHLVPFGGDSLVARRPCSSVPSLLALAGLRAGAERTGAAKRLGIVSVPRLHDRAELIAAMVRTRSAAQQLARRHDLESDELLDEAATPSAILALMARVDIALLATHGVARSAGGGNALLLATGDGLPTALANAADNPVARPNLLTWQRLGRGGTPRVVVSAACSSGAKSTFAGGERVGFDRSLLAAGTTTFVAPLWDVDMDDAQRLLLALLDLRLGEAESWPAAWTRVLASMRDDVSAASWQAFTVIGDWRD